MSQSFSKPTSTPPITESMPTMNNTLSQNMNSTLSQNMGTQNNSSFLYSKTFRVIIVIVILAFLGINLFKYLANTTDIITKYFSPSVITFLKDIGIITAETTENIVKTTDKGIKATSTAASDLITKPIDAALGKSINTKKIENKPKPDNSGSKTQLSKGKLSSGYCYIGEDRGFRSCIHVNDTDTCESGMIYPTQKLCIHPNLRP